MSLSFDVGPKRDDNDITSLAKLTSAFGASVHPPRPLSYLISAMRLVRSNTWYCDGIPSYTVLGESYELQSSATHMGFTLLPHDLMGLRSGRLWNIHRQDCNITYNAFY